MINRTVAFGNSNEGFQGSKRATGCRGFEFKVRQQARVEVDVQGRGWPESYLAQPKCPLTAVAERSVSCDSSNDDPEGPSPPIPRSKSDPPRSAPNGVRKPGCRCRGSLVSIRRVR